MKIVLKERRYSAMTRIEFLIVVCVALLGIYLFVRYQKTGEVFQISWRKAAGKTNSGLETIQSAEIRFTNQTSKLDETDSNVASINIIRKSTNENSTPVIPGMRLDDRKKQTVRVPTNSVWAPPQRRGPGVRIAFP